jgi:hypothetical protein
MTGDNQAHGRRRKTRPTAWPTLASTSRQENAADFVEAART